MLSASAGEGGRVSYPAPFFMFMRRPASAGDPRAAFGGRFTRSE